MGWFDLYDGMQEDTSASPGFTASEPPDMGARSTATDNPNRYTDPLNQLNWYGNPTLGVIAGVALIWLAYKLVGK